MKTLAAVLCLVFGVTAPSWAQTTDRFDVLVGLARVKRDGGDAVSARRYFEQARELESFDHGLLTEYFWVVADVSPAEAVAIGRQLLSQHPQADDIRDRTVAAAVAAGDEATALAVARAGAGHDARQALWHRRVAESLARQGQMADAVAAWEAVLATGDAVDSDRAGLAQALEAAGQHARAVTVWAQVPAPVLRQQEAWQRSRLRSLVQAAPSADAARDVEAWLASHVDDRMMREALVDLWRRAGNIESARAALRPLLDGPDRWRWWRQDAYLARLAGDTAAAVDAFGRLMANGHATPADRLALAELLLDDRAFDRAVSVLQPLADAAGGCDPAVLTAIDRVPGAAGTPLLLEALTSPDCRGRPVWVERGIVRATADGRHAEALTLFDALPAARRSADDMRRLGGQLRLWTGDWAGAVSALAPLVAERPEDLTAREALVDAHRGLGAPSAAWRVAGPLVAGASTSAERLLMLAELALEADQPEAVARLLTRVPPDAAPASTRAALEGRALAALGRPAEAVIRLSSVAGTDLPAPAALALVDSLHSLRGVDAALEGIRHLDVDALNSMDLRARRVMLEMLARTAEGVPASRAALVATDPSLATLVDAEVALAEQRPLDALAILATLPAGAYPQRSADLRVTALSGSGNLRAAAEALRPLRAARPDFVAFILREAELAWKLRPAGDTLGTLLALPSRFPGNRHAAVVAARALALEQRHAEVMAILGAAPPEGLTVEGRVLMARSLSATGSNGAAWPMVAGLSLRGPDAIFRAGLMAHVEGEHAAALEFRSLAARPDASADLFVAWAAFTSEPAARLGVLEEGARRFRGHAPLLTSLAVARATTGDREGSVTAAREAVAVDPESGEAWFQWITNTRGLGSAEDLEAVLTRFSAVAAAKPALAIVLADRVAALVRSPFDPILVSALEWLHAEVAEPRLRVSRALVTVRLYAAGERWFEALAVADRAVLAHPESTEALRLRADVLAWAGRHDEGIAAYDEYLNAVPTDLDARRQQARVAGWAGRVHDASRYYEDLRRRYPDHRAIALEADAKRAFHAGRWRDAIDRYQRWLAVEPDDSEARFEMAEALRAAGDFERAEAALARLSPDGSHRLADAVRDREAWRRDPTVTAVAGLTSADGYDQQRLIDLRSTGGRFSTAAGPLGRTVVSAEALSRHVSSSDVTRRGYQLGLSAGRRLSRGTADAQVAVWDLSGPGHPIVQAAALAGWSPADWWTLQAEVGRELLVDNLATIDRRVMATGASIGATFEHPHASVQVRAGRQRLSDTNTRTRITMSASGRIRDRWSRLRAVAWSELIDYARPSDLYFSPRRFLRVDAGLEYTHPFSQPRFRGDRADGVAAGYLLGTDSRGVVYHHPSLRLTWELRPTVAVSVRGDVVRSRDYREQSLLVSLHLLGGAFSR